MIIVKQINISKGKGKLRTKKTKNDPFLTSTGVAQNIREIEKPTAELEELNIDDKEVLDNLNTFITGDDDLAELRRMIKKTKRDITEYADGVCNLNKIIGDIRKDTPHFMSNYENELSVLDTKMEKLMPGGNPNKLWERKKKK